jgi:hypothetical protein
MEHPATTSDFKTTARTCSANRYAGLSISSWAYMKKAGVLLVALVLVAKPALAITADEVLNLVHRQGAHATVAALVGTEDWEQVIQGVASGRPDWLQVAEESLAGADAGANSELRDAMAWALPIAPAQVLELVSRKKADWAYVCSGPPVDFPVGGSASYFQRAITAVTSVKEEALQGTKDYCVSQLKSAQNSVEAQP